MTEDEDRRVVDRVRSPPSRPIEVPLAAVVTKHVAAHDVGAGEGDRIGLVAVFVAMIELPGVQAVLVEVAERALGALPPPGPVAIT